MDSLQFDTQTGKGQRQELGSSFIHGFRLGVPIALGYLPVSFTFGLVAVIGGIPPGMAVLISLTNLTSAGQFAGTTLIVAGAPLIEIAFTTFVINIRYLLMSLSLSQKVVPGMSLVQRSLVAFGITDEVFAVASLETREVSFPYMMGLIVGPYGGWALGTLLGALTCSLLPATVQNAMGIALYAMFIALLVPVVKESKPAFVVMAVGIGISSAFTWLPGLVGRMSQGWVIVLATVVAASLGALVFPREVEGQ